MYQARKYKTTKFVTVYKYIPIHQVDNEIAAWQTFIIFEVCLWYLLALTISAAAA